MYLISKMVGFVIFGVKIVLGNPALEENSSGEPPPVPSPSQERLNLLDHHLVILLVIFIDCGLLDVSVM